MNQSENGVGNVAKFGMLVDSTFNVGDAIQSLAASRFLPKVDSYIQRERVGVFSPADEESYKVIMNAWWIHDTRFFPPSPYVDPLLISMHIFRGIRSFFLNDKTKKFFLDHGPVGCRDENTRDYLIENGIPAYFSGCMTLTLQRNIKIPRRDYVLCIDVPQQAVDAIKKRTSRPVICLSKNVLSTISAESKFKVARAFLRMYHDAHCVVSPNLHTVMPSLALETPVLRLDIGNDFDSVSRYSGLEELYNAVSVSQLIEDENCYDFDCPKANPTKYLELRQGLVEKCTAFTGYDRGVSLLDENDDLTLELLYALQYNYQDNIHKACFCATPKSLIEGFFLRLFKKKNRFDF